MVNLNFNFLQVHFVFELNSLCYFEILLRKWRTNQVKHFSHSYVGADNRYDDSDTPDNILGQLVAVGWPSWLAAVAGEALKGWLPRRADTFKNLGKASIAYLDCFG